MKENKDIPSKKNKVKKENTASKKWWIVAGAIVGLLVIVGIVLGVVFFKSDLSQEEEQSGSHQVVKEEKKLSQEEMDMASARQANMESLEAAWKDMWLKDIEIGEDSSNFLTINSCEIYDADTSVVCVSGVLPGIPVSDSDDIYLFALDSFASSIPEGAEPAGTYRIEKTEPTFKMFANLNHKQSGSRLFKKFVIAAKVNGQYKILSSSRYITNPEKVCKYNVYKKAAGIKGVLVDPAKIYGSELDDLGVQQGVYNIPMQNILGGSGGISYEYCGKTYTFNAAALAGFDEVFKELTKRNIQITAILLNNNSAYPELIHPKASGGAPYNMFNAANQDGINAMAAVASYLTERYSGNGHGLISNWIIGNEVNMRKEWNNYENVSIGEYSHAYADSFRVMYNAIKSVNGSANVYMPLDQTWNRNRNDGDYDARDMIDNFAAYIKEKGDIDWGLAYHPYPVPLTNARFWDTGSYKKYTIDSVDTPMVCMKNVHVVTDYMTRSELRDKRGEVRSIILSEEGFTSTSGEAVQAAAYAYAYYIAVNNQYIDGFMISRQTDSGLEGSQGMAFGLTDAGGRHKQVYNVFKYINQPNGHDYTDFALSVIGVNSWSEIIHSH